MTRLLAVPEAGPKLGPERVGKSVMMVFLLVAV
jgi:hypothetical protein